MKEKICTVCGKAFIPKYQTQQCCSVDCGMISGHEKLKKYHVCQNCGKKYIRSGGHPQKFCSRQCFTEWRLNHHVKKKNTEPVIHHKECDWCRKQFDTRFPNQKFCSKECGYEANKKRKRDIWAGEYIPKTYVCKECGSVFTTECGDTHSVFCCSSCADKYERRIEHQTSRHKSYMHKYKTLREKQVLKNFVEDVSYDKIFKRDNGICQICGLPVIYDKHADANWSGTIDHIIPVSHNGEHSMKNCQLAHRVCNSLKGQFGYGYSIDWNKKAKENNYWKIKYKTLMKSMESCPQPPSESL